MKKVFAISLMLNIALLVGLQRKNSIVQAAGGGGGLIRNGDVNADGAVDISDVSYLVNALFLGGPDLKPIECPPGAGKGLPFTGQGGCYAFAGQGWSEVPCDKAICLGQDAFYSNGCTNERRFIDNLNGTVADTCTGLIWLKDTADVNLDGQHTAEGDAIEWCDALTFCENLEFAGQNDWRLPNVRELQSILDYGSRSISSIDPVFGAFSVPYWSSTSFANDAVGAWFVNFTYGGIDFRAKDNLFCVRAVRNGP